jgi:uncharacterized protein (DUF362 family)
VGERPDARVAIVTRAPSSEARARTDDGAVRMSFGGPTPAELLADALAAIDLRARLAVRAHAAGRPLRVVIVPDLGGFERGGPLATDPALVEALIDQLHDAGHPDVVVGRALDGSDRWLANRDPLALADLLGYRFVTAAGRPYDVVDLSADLAPAGFPPESALHGSKLARAWLEADVRIVFAKSRTDERHGYALAAVNLLGVLPLRDKHYHYELRLDPADVVEDLLRLTPVDVALVDALVSNHGSFGASVARPLTTRTLIAGTDPVLVDWAGAAKMDVDPCRSPINARLLADRGLPSPHEVVGDLAPWAGWRNVHPTVLDSTARLARSLALGRALAQVKPTVDRGRFPFRDPRADSLNRLLAPRFAAADDSAAGLAAVVGLQYQLAAADETARAWTTLVAKDRLPRRDVPLGLDLARYQPADYQAVIGYLEPLWALVRATAADAHGLKHRRVGGSIVFEYTRLLAAPFARFVVRVPIERAVQMMNDYIGGRAVAVERDADGRVVRQAERSIFLPQPGFMVFYKGQPIDVGKLEIVERGAGRHRIWWRTVTTANGSADFDDGIVTFDDAGADGTRVTLVARQRFTLPPLWQAAELELNPEVRNAIELWAYRAYFDGTMNNYEACYEGRDHRIGRPLVDDDGEPVEPTTDPLAALEGVLQKLGVGGGLRAKLGSAVQAVRRAPAPYATDEQGFEHFRPDEARREPAPIQARRWLSSIVGAARGVARELSAAVARDLGKPPAGEG